MSQRLARWIESGSSTGADTASGSAGKREVAIDPAQNEFRWVSSLWQCPGLKKHGARAIAVTSSRARARLDPFQSECGRLQRLGQGHFARHRI